MQLNQQFADLNNAWQSHTVVPQSLVMPGPTNAQLSNSGQIPTQAPGQAQPLTQFQASNASLTMPMGPFQNMQPMNVAPNGFGNVAGKHVYYAQESKANISVAFQNGNVAAANGNLFPPQNDNDEAVNPESAWGPFNQQA